MMLGDCPRCGNSKTFANLQRIDDQAAWHFRCGRCRFNWQIELPDKTIKYKESKDSSLIKNRKVREI